MKKIALTALAAAFALSAFGAGETAPKQRGETVEKLIAKNPFGSKNAASRGGAKAAGLGADAKRASLELRAIYCVDGKWKFDLFDTAAKTSYTVGLRQEISEKTPYTIDFYDDETNSVSVSSNLESLTLTLKTPDTPTGAAPQPAKIGAPAAATADKNGAAKAQRQAGARKATEQKR